MKSGLLQGKTALITGGARGIGQAIATRFSSEGAAVALVDLPTSRLAETARELQGSKDVTVHAIAADLRNLDEIRAAVAETVERLGSIDLLVNNAGIAPEVPFLETGPEDYDQIMAVNARGSFFCAQEVTRHMIAAGGGCIVQIASICALPAGALRNYAAYNMSKAAVRQMAASLANELARYCIRVNAVAPGSIDTELTRSLLPTSMKQEEVVKAIPMRRLGQPHEIAAACAFLGSDDASYITGATLLVDGGWLVQ